MNFFNKQKNSGNEGFTPTPSFVSLCSVLDSFLNKFKYCKKLFLKTFINSTTKNTTQNLVSGFTLIETMVAIFILTTSLASLLTLTTSSLFASKYANNEITANYLLQEVVDYIRNDRDSVAFQQVSSGGGWGKFIEKYGNVNTSCFSIDGCYIEITETTQNEMVKGCNTAPSWGASYCPVLKYDDTASSKQNFYNYDNNSIPSTFNRIIKMSKNELRDEIDITVTVEWLNGSIVRSRSLRSSLLNWQLQP